MEQEEKGIRVEQLVAAEGFKKEEKGQEYLFLLIRAGLMCLASLGVLYAFATVFPLEVSTGLLLAMIIVLCVANTIFFLFFKKNKWILLIWIALLALIAIVFRATVSDGIKVMYNLLAGKANEYYDIRLPLAAIGAIPQGRQMVSLFLIFACITMILGFGIVYYLDARTTALVMVVPLALSLALGTFPGMLSIVLMLVSLLGVFFLQNTKLHEGLRRNVIGISLGSSQTAKLRSQVAAAAVAFCLLLLPIGYFTLGPTINNGYESQSELREDLQSGEFLNGMRDFWKKLVRGEWDWLPFDIVRSSGVHGGKLSNVKEIKVYDELHLYLDISDDLQAPLYIRGYVGSNYTGQGWRAQTNEQKEAARAAGMSVSDLSKMYYSALETLQQQNLASIYGRLRFVITNQEANSSYSYIPYGTDISEFEASSAYDTYTEEKTDENILDLMYMNTQKLSNLQALEEIGAQNTEDMAYREYVRNNYLDVPSEGLERFHAEFDGMSFASAADAVAYVRETLAQKAVYTMAPGAVPKGNDYVEYFLYENKQGFCTNFASAAVLMFRTFGIPARYVEGYMTTSLLAEGGPNEIMDESAHAWVEIYIDGAGWAPIEVTPGFINETDMQDDRQDQNPENNIDDVNNPPEETTQSFEEEENTQEETTADPYVIEAPSTQAEPTPPSNEQNQQNTQSPSEPDPDNQEDDNELVKTILKIVIILIVTIFVIFALLYLIRFLYQRRQRMREEKLTGGSSRDGILAGMALIEKMTQSAGMELDEYSNAKDILGRYSVLNKKMLSRYQSLCLEAGFSLHEFDEPTRNEIINIYTRLANSILGEKKGISRWIFKFLYL